VYYLGRNLHLSRSRATKNIMPDVNTLAVIVGIVDGLLVVASAVIGLQSSLC